MPTKHAEILQISDCGTVSITRADGHHWRNYHPGAASLQRLYRLLLDIGVEHHRHIPIARDFYVWQWTRR